MNDLETMLRASLQERADDVEPTPELWQQVQRRVARRRAMPLLVWTAAGVAAAVTAVAVVPGLVDRMSDGFVIDPAQSPSAPATVDEPPVGPVAAAPLTHYVAVVDGRLVLRGVDGSEEVLWEGESEVRTLAVRPGAAPDDLTVAYITSAEGMFDLRIHADGALVGALFVGPDTGGETAPTLAWSPDGRTVAVSFAGELQLLDVDRLAADGDVGTSRVMLAGLEDASGLRLQDWANDDGAESLWFTAAGELYRAPVGAAGDGWEVGALEGEDGGDYVVDVATHPDGRLYRLLAGQGAGSGDAEDAGLGLFLDDRPLAYPDLATADPSGVWMTAVDGGVFVGLGSDARQIHVGDEDEADRATMLAVPGVSYASWVPVAGQSADPVPTSAPTTDAPRADGPLSESGVTPYVAVDEEGRVAVHTADGGEREVIIDEQLWAPEAAVSVIDVTVRPGSSPGEVSGMLLLATEGGPELAWFRAAAGETSVRRLEGAYGLGPAADDPRDAPTFSPDGLHLAWVEPDDAGRWTLRTLGVDDDGPTDEDASFGLDIGSDLLRIADWTWTDEAADGTALGTVTLVDNGRHYVLPVERQGDGALAVGSTSGVPRGEGPEGDTLDAGVRGDSLLTLVVDGETVSLWQVGPALIPAAAGAAAYDLDLDVLDDIAVVTDRRTGQAWVVDRAGGVAPLEADAATTYGFDPIR